MTEHSPEHDRIATAYLVTIEHARDEPPILLVTEGARIVSVQVYRPEGTQT